MRKTFFCVLSSMFLLAMTVGLRAQTGSSTNLIDVGFEDGKIPHGWTMVHERGSHDWTVARDNAFEGQYCLELVNKTTLQQNYRTLFVSPALDITKIKMPVVVFAHRQYQRTGDVDTLRVFGRQAPDRGWIKLAELGAETSDWKVETVFLNNPSPTYQIAFSGSDNMGGGIGIDNITVIPSPSCVQPYNIHISSPSDVSCYLHWSAGFEAQTIKVKVSTKELTPEQLDAAEKLDALVVDAEVSGAETNMFIDKLVPGTEYFAYIRSICTNERSDWSDVFCFSTTYRAHIPFYADFNMPYQAGYNSYPEHWVCNTSTGKQSPLINTSFPVSNWGNYSRDVTTALCFAAMNPNSSIAANEWSYAATPMIDAESVQDLHVSFEARVYQQMGKDIHKIILGVMSDPYNINSFVAVDTFCCDKIKEYYTFTASLAKYDGDGKYIALLSRFDESNLIYIDNFRIDYEGETKTPSDVKVKVKSATELEILWDAYGAPMADIVLSKKYTYPSAAPVEEGDTVKVINGVTAGQYTVSGLTPWDEYYVYVRNVNGDKKSPWSTGEYCRMPQSMTGEGMSFDFEIDKADATTYYCNVLYPVTVYELDRFIMATGCLTLHETTNANSLPITDKQSHHAGAYGLTLTLWNGDSYTCAIFPAIDNIRDYRVKFWHKCWSSEKKDNCFIVGIMDDLSDIGSFHPLETVLSDTREWLQHTLCFDTYPADKEGRFFAILFKDDDNPHLTVEAQSSGKLFIDDVEFDKIPSACRTPDDVEVLTTETTATMSWTKTADAYNVRVHSTTLTVDQLNDPDFSFVFKADGVTELPVVIENLDAQQCRHYYYIQPVCGSEKGEWNTSSGASFRTQCISRHLLPYTLDFNGFLHNGSQEPEFVVPCLYTHMDKVKSNYFPRLYDNSSYTRDAALNLCADTVNVTSTAASFPNETYLALPDMDVADLSEVQMTFLLKANQIQADMLEVGVMTDPDDLTTFEKYADVNVRERHKYCEIIVPFDGYKGSGRHIAFHLKPAKGQTQYYVDSIVVEKLRCRKAVDLKILNVTATSARLGWTDGNPGLWNLVLSTQALSAEQLENVEVGTNGVVFADVVNSNPYDVTDGLDPNTYYWFYVRGICSATDKAFWPFEAGQFRTACSPIELGEGGVQDFENKVGSSFNCWVMGNISNPDMYKPVQSNRYSHSGTMSLQFNSTRDYNGAYAVSPMLNVDDIRKVDMTFWGTTLKDYSDPDNYGCRLEIGVVSSPYDLSSFVPLATVYGYGEEQQYRVRFDRFKSDDPEDGRYIMFKSEYDGTNFFYIDDVRFDLTGDCAVPVDLAAADVTGNSAKITWRGGAAPYTVVYSDRPFTDEELNGGAGSVVSGIEAAESEIKNLKRLTTYYVYVKSGCNDVWSSPLRVTTECNARYCLPFSDNFDVNPYAGRAPMCWYSYCTDSKLNYPVLYDQSAVDKSAYIGKSVCLYSNPNYNISESVSTSYLTSPAIDVDDITDCYVSFYAAGYAAEQRNLIIGLVSDVSSVEQSFVPVDTIFITSAGFSKYIVPLHLDGYKAKGKHVAFTTDPFLNRNASGGFTKANIYIDEVEIGMYVPCPMPDYVSVAYLSDTEVAGTFRELGDATVWQALCVAPETDISTVTPVELTQQQFAFNGLSPRTDYEIYLRSACSEAAGGYSGWHGPYDVRTTNTPAALQYSTGFETAAADNAEWSFANDETNRWHIGDAIGKGGVGGLYISNDNGITSQYTIDKPAVSWAYRPVKLEPGSYRVEFDWIGFGDYSDYMRVGLLPVEISFNGGSRTIVYGNGNTFTVANTAEGTPREWISLEGLDYSYNQQYKLNMKNQWQHNKVELTIERGGVYNIAVMWTNNQAGGTLPAPAIDNLSIKQICSQPSNVRVDEFDRNSATVIWDEQSAASEWEVFVTTNYNLSSPDYVTSKADTLYSETVTTNRCTIPGLVEWTKYYVFVREVCGAGEYSPWSEKLTVRLECSEKPLETTFDFDADFVNDPAYADKSLKPKCFTFGHSRNLSLPMNNVFYPYIAATNYSGSTAHSGNNAIFFGCDKSNSQTLGGYMVLPAFDTESLEGKQVTFWMRPITHMASTGMVQTHMGYDRQVNVLDNTFARSITVGTMTDPTDFSTFKEIEVVTYPYTSQDININTRISDDPAGNNWWRKYTVILPEDCGRYIVFYNATDYGKSRNAMYVDDIFVGEVPECSAPVGVTVKNVHGTSAEVEFAGRGTDSRWVLHIASAANMADTVQCDTVNVAGIHTVGGLTPETIYYLHVSQLCDGVDEPQVSDVVMFQTIAALPFTESFDRQVLIPYKWLRASSICSVNDLYNNSCSLTFNTDDEKNPGWKRSIQGDEYVTLSRLMGGSNILFTPVIDMSGDGDMKLSLDVALTSPDSYLPADDAFMTHEGVKFIVLVSDDAGATWKRENATVWNNTGNGDYAFSDLSNEWKKFFIDMSDYRGKYVQLAFCSAFESVSGERIISADLHIDNVRLNVTKTVDFEDETCELKNYRNNGFSCHHSELTLGVNEKSWFALAADDAKPDTVYNLTLTVNSLTKTYVEDSVCKGDIYDKYNFSTNIGGVQKQKFSFIDGRCDSLVYLNLTVIPIPTSVETVTICQGQRYKWNGNFYDRSGVYTDTVPAKSCKCDSIITLVLTVTEAVVYEVDDVLCYGETVEFGDKVLNTGGVYRDTVRDDSGCLTIKELRLTALPDYRRSFMAYICEGEEYTDENFVGVTKSGTYRNELKSTVGGCDSTITMTLVVLKGDTTRTSNIITVDRLPFTIEGTDIMYGTDTKLGEYTDTVTVRTDNCTSVLIHTLVVKDNTGVENVNVKTLVLAPNPVAVNEILTVFLELTPAERRGMIVQLYSNTGTLIRQFTPDHDPIQVGGFRIPDLYIIRIIDGTGKVYVGKVIAR